MSVQIENKILKKVIELILLSIQDDNCRCTDRHLQHIYDTCHEKAIQILKLEKYTNENKPRI